MKFRSLVVAASTVAVAAAAPAVAGAASTGTPQIVAGTTASTISINVATPAAFGTDFAPSGNEVSSTGGTVVALSTSPNWNLQVKDYGTSGSNGNGKMDALSATDSASLLALGNPLLCNGSESELQHAAKVQIDPSVVSSTILSDGKKTLDGTGTQIAHSGGTTLLPLSLTTFGTTFYQTIDTTEQVSTGCIYHIMAAYTLS